MLKTSGSLKKGKKGRLLACIALVCVCLAGAGVAQAASAAGSADAGDAAGTQATAEPADKVTAADVGTASEKGAASDTAGTADASTAPAEPDPELVAWAEGSDCLSCHTREADGADSQDCLFGKHAFATTLDCIDCHTDIQLVDLHKNAKDGKRMPKRLKKTSVSDAVCSTCHATDDLIEVTKDSTVLIDTSGTVVNPHAQLTDELHAKGGSTGANVGCFSCHSVHKEATVEKTAVAYCKNCHHAGVYACYTCHE